MESDNWNHAVVRHRRQLWETWVSARVSSTSAHATAKRRTAFDPAKDYFRDVAVAMTDEATNDATLADLAEDHGIQLLDEY